MWVRVCPRVHGTTDAVFIFTSQLVAKDAARLVIEAEEAVLYHIMDNDRYAHMGAEDDGDGEPVDEEEADAAAREEGRGVMVRSLPPFPRVLRRRVSACQQFVTHGIRSH